MLVPQCGLLLRVTAALLLDPMPGWRFIPRCRLPPVAVWYISRRCRNRATHALHGNGPPARGWQAVGGRGGEAHWLQQPQQAGKLRHAGWTLPQEVKDDYLLRVYDTRVQPAWLRQLAEEASGVKREATRVIGGDFLTDTTVEDPEALTSDIHRWGPAGDGPYHLLVPPRPHLATWAERCAIQMKVEAPGTICTLCAVVPRNKLEGGLTVSALRRHLPQAAVLLDDTTLDKDIVLVGERAPLRKVPATNEDKTLPPKNWEDSWLPVSRALVLIMVRQAVGGVGRMTVRSLRGELPAMPASELELLRLEYILPPTTRQRDAERATRAALRKVASSMGLPEPPLHQLRQVQVQHGGLLAILGVPKLQSRQWLAGSGCGGLYLRPFWHEHTGQAVKRENFQLLWARGIADQGPSLWDAFHSKPGVVGLLLSGRDVALRITADANVAELQVQLRHSLKDAAATFRMATPGQRWWKLGPLTESETWKVKELITLLGLVPLRGEVRIAEAGPFRRAAYFAAVGNPTCNTLDDGSWNSSAAKLTPAEPPPRRSAPTNVAIGARAAASRPGPALAQHSVWGGARSSVDPSSRPSHVASPQIHSTGPPTATQQRSPAAAPHASQPERPQRSQPAPLSSQSRSPKRTSLLPNQDLSQEAGRLHRKAGRTTPSSAVEDRLDRLIGQVEELTRANAAMALELRALRHENATLRSQLQTSQGVHVHQPYATTTPSPMGLPSLLPPLPPAEDDVLMVDSTVTAPSGCVAEGAQHHGF